MVPRSFVGWIVISIAKTCLDKGIKIGNGGGLDDAVPDIDG